MDHNNLPSFNVAFGELAGRSSQDDRILSLLNYQGRFVRTLNSPCGAIFSQSNADQNSAHAVSPLNEFSVAPVTQASSDSFDESDLSVISGSICDQYVTYNPDKKSGEERFPRPGNSLSSQSHLSDNEPDLSKLTPSNRLNLNHDLTNLPAELACPQDSRPVAVVNPLNLQQTNSDNPVNSTIIVTDKSSQAERRKKRKNERKKERYQNDPVFAERERERQRKRYRNDPAFAERCRHYQKKYQKQRYQNDPAFAERQRSRLRERFRSDPVYANGKKIYCSTYRKMKRKFGKEAASKLASAARDEYLRSVNASGGSGNLPQTSNPA